MGVRLGTRLLAGTTFVAAFGLFAAPCAAVTAGPSCGQQVVKNDQGVKVLIQFAKNGAVQRFVVNDRDQNLEDVHSMRLALEQQFGPEGVNAPPLRIVSFKAVKGTSLQVPDKAVDSCGRIVSFQQH